LDVLVYAENNEIHTDLFRKETDSLNYIHFFSNHPKHTKRSIPYNIARRICTIVDTPYKKEQHLKELKSTLLDLKYPILLINDAIKKATSIPQDVLRQIKPKPSKDVITLVTTFNHNNPSVFRQIKAGYDFLSTDCELGHIFRNIKLINSQRQPPNMKRKLTSSYITQKSHFTRPCNNARCGCCNHLVATDHFKFHQTGKTFYIRTELTCSSNNLIYVLICAGCDEYYIGETGDTIRARVRVHRQHINNANCAPLKVSRHVAACTSFSIIKFRVVPFYKLTEDNPALRKEKEKYFIDLFKPQLNSQ
jgi:hypothetical protein